MKTDMTAANEVAISLGADLDIAFSFAEICNFLTIDPSRLVSRGKSKLCLNSRDDLAKLAKRYIKAHTKSDFPAVPGTVPDSMVSIVLQKAFGYSRQQTSQIEVEHQHAMGAENCVGALLERYLDSVLRSHGWNWCCGDLVKAVDFVRRDESGGWIALQVKNRDNSENSSSSAIRAGTSIEKWFRTFSRTGKTNWENMPSLMRGYSLSEEGFASYATVYLNTEKKRLSNKQ